MQAKENALRILNFDHPERMVNSPPWYQLTYLGCNHENLQTGLGHEQPVGSVWDDIWGTEFHKEMDGVMAFPRGNPLAEPAALKDYIWPDPNDERLCGKIYSLVREYPGGDVFLAGQNRDTLWEKSYMLVGMENMMVYFFTEPEYVREILHRIMDFQLGIAAHYAGLGIEWACLGDDLGTQRGLLLGPGIVRDFLLPEYRRLFGFYQERGIKIFFHSCGYIEPLLETFMELGVDVLDPVQATANDLEKVRKITQGRMALHGGISSGLVMSGPLDAIARDVREKMWLLGGEGGYYPWADQGMPYPREHLEALQRAIDAYGVYPLVDPYAE